MTADLFLLVEVLLRLWWIIALAGVLLGVTWWLER